METTIKENDYISQPSQPHDNLAIIFILVVRTKSNTIRQSFARKTF